MATDYVTLRRWALKPGNDEAVLLTFVNDQLAPAWRKIPGCLSLNLLRVRGQQSYLAVVYWETKEACDSWSGAAGQAWRDEHRAVLERWLDLTSYQDETEADLLVVG